MEKDILSLYLKLMMNKMSNFSAVRKKSSLESKMNKKLRVYKFSLGEDLNHIN